MNKRVYIGTYGCQMNERDSEEVLGMLTSQGYTLAQSEQDADIILLNTCSVRQHAEERAVGKMGELSQLKDDRPELVLGIIGCMAKLRQKELFKHLPKLDLVAGPAELYDLPFLLAEIQQKRQAAKKYLIKHTRVMAVGRQFRPLDKKPEGASFHRPGIPAFVTIMEGCDKACTYCIVPKTRGQEISRLPEEIIVEINRLVANGYKEITLLGQNVNSYGKRFSDGSGYKGPLGRLRLLEEDPETLLDFPQLLRLVSRRTNAERVRFTTSHPFDANERLFAAIRDCGNVCEYLHLPVQSGSNRILRAMRRGYTAEAYLRKIEQLRGFVPDISLSTDIIVGFPGETEEDYQATVHLMERVGFENAFIFKYSPRPGTDAAAKEDDVPLEVKEERHQNLVKLQNSWQETRHKAWEGRAFEILVEEKGKFERQWFGRTRGNLGMIVDSDHDLFGQVVSATVTRGTAHTLFGGLADVT